MLAVYQCCIHGNITALCVGNTRLSLFGLFKMAQVLIGHMLLPLLIHCESLGSGNQVNTYTQCKNAVMFPLRNNNTHKPTHTSDGWLQWSAPPYRHVHSRACSLYLLCPVALRFAMWGEAYLAAAWTGDTSAAASPLLPSHVDMACCTAEHTRAVDHRLVVDNRSLRGCR